eukprot:scaffold300997_cov22-Tisochrysis_lutea.AAC.1
MNRSIFILSTSQQIALSTMGEANIRAFLGFSLSPGCCLQHSSLPVTCIPDYLTGYAPQS